MRNQASALNQALTLMREYVAIGAKYVANRRKYAHVIMGNRKMVQEGPSVMKRSSGSGAWQA